MNWVAYSDLLRERKEAGFRYLLDKWLLVPEDEVYDKYTMVFQTIQSEAKGK